MQADDHFQTGRPAAASKEQPLGIPSWQRTSVRVSALIRGVFSLGEECSHRGNVLFRSRPVLDILRKDLTLVMVELNDSLDTLRSRRLAQHFLNVDHNKNGAQLILTANGTSLLDSPICSAGSSSGL